MKRFWKIADVVETGAAFGIALDGRTVKTPDRADLLIPTRALADAIAAEWNGCGEEIDPRAMPLTGFANAAIDRVAPNRATFAADIARYGESDLLCYRADGPQPLIDQQTALWDPLLDWARRRYDVDFVTSDGLMHVAQPEVTVGRLGDAVSALDDFRLAGLSPLVGIGGSLVTGLAVMGGDVSADAGWEAVSVDERWQIDQWGADDEAVKALENRRRDFLSAAGFVALL